jgi:hypothetical protein
VKLQYLGDSRDAFKWDLLHWLCSRSAPSFSKLAFVPLLTPDDPNPSDGKTPHHWFSCRSDIRGFVESLGRLPRTLDRVVELGKLDDARPFDVVVTPANLHFPAGYRRREYWSAAGLEALENTIVFLDPDNGFETRTQRGEKWVEHGEVSRLLDGLANSSAIVVYQHRPRRTWKALFEDLRAAIEYSPFISAVVEANLAFFILARDAATGERLGTAAHAYCNGHPSAVRYVPLSPRA